MCKLSTDQAPTPGLKEADILLAVTDRDEVNLVACFFANIIAPRVRKVALIRNPDYTEYREALSRSISNITTSLPDDY